MLLPHLIQAPHVESLTQDQRLLLADPAGESDDVEAARETFIYLWQYLQSLESEVSCSTSLPTLPTQYVQPNMRVSVATH